MTANFIQGECFRLPCPTMLHLPSSNPSWLATTFNYNSGHITMTIVLASIACKATANMGKHFGGAGPHENAGPLKHSTVPTFIIPSASGTLTSLLYTHSYISNLSNFYISSCVRCDDLLPPYKIYSLLGYLSVRPLAGGTQVRHTTLTLSIALRKDLIHQKRLLDPPIMSAEDLHPIPFLRPTPEVDRLKMARIRHSLESIRKETQIWSEVGQPAHVVPTIMNPRLIHVHTIHFLF